MLNIFKMLVNKSNTDLCFEFLIRKPVWREILFLMSSFSWCSLASFIYNFLTTLWSGVGKVEAVESIHRLPPHRFVLSRGRNLLFQICELLNSKPYKAAEGHRDGETLAAVAAVCRILSSSSFPNLCQASCMLLCSQCYHRFRMSLSPALLGMSYI